MPRLAHLHPHLVLACPSYEKGYLATDLIAALTVWALVVSEAMA